MIDDKELPPPPFIYVIFTMISYVFLEKNENLCAKNCSLDSLLALVREQLFFVRIKLFNVSVQSFLVV